MKSSCTRKQEGQHARKIAAEKKLRHASRVAKPRPVAVRNGSSLDDERAWLNW